MDCKQSASLLVAAIVPEPSDVGGRAAAAAHAQPAGSPRRDASFSFLDSSHLWRSRGSLDPRQPQVGFTF
jgi:hypothetical protein